MDRTPATLLEQLRKPGAQDAWSRFVELYTPLLYSWVHRVGLQEPDASDLVQDVFTLLVQKLPHFEYDGRRSFRAWLRTLTLNRWRNSLRRRPVLPLPEDEDALARVIDPHGTEDFWEADYRRQLVNRALQLIEEEFQPATWKAWWEYVVRGRPAAEVAAELGISVNAVYLAKSRVLGRLRRELSGLLD